MSYKLDAASLALIFKKIKANFVQQETGKGLSTNDYTNEAKSKLERITVPTKTSELTNDSGFLTTSDIPEGAAASTTTPKMAGAAAVGTEMAFARGDHIHPTDTSRVPVTRTINGKALDKDISLAAADVGAATPTEVAAAKQEAIETILGGQLDTTKDTIKELADWSQSDTTNSAKRITRVSNIENNYVKSEDLATLTQTEIDSVWDNA